MAEQKLKDIKDKQERQWAVESAANTLREFARICGDPDLVAEAVKKLDEEQNDAEAAKNFINSLSSKSAGMKVKDEG